MKKSKRITIGFVMCGSFCTLSKAIDQMEVLSKLGYDILPIMSYNVFKFDTKFGKAADFITRVEKISGKKIINTIQDAEPIGPKKMADIILVAPCTGNTLAKLYCGITDTPALMAIKSNLRIKRPVVISLATNDALGASAKNIGKLLNTKNIYFVPLKQDDPKKKPLSLVANFDLIPQTLEKALSKKQIQPIFI